MRPAERHSRNTVHNLDGGGATLSRAVSELPFRIVAPHPERPIAINRGGITSAQRNGSDIIHYHFWLIVGVVVSRPVAKLAMRILAPRPKRSVALDGGGMKIAERNADDIVHELCGSESMGTARILVTDHALPVPAPRPKLPVIFDGSRKICSESNARNIVHKLVRRTRVIITRAQQISELKFLVTAPDPKLSILGDRSRMILACRGDGVSERQRLG